MTGTSDPLTTTVQQSSVLGASSFLGGSGGTGGTSGGTADPNHNFGSGLTGGHLTTDLTNFENLVDPSRNGGSTAGTGSTTHDPASTGIGSANTDGTQNLRDLFGNHNPNGHGH